MLQTAPAARRFVTLRASAKVVVRKLEAHSLLARRFVTLRASGNDVMRKLEVHSLLAAAVLKALRGTEKRMDNLCQKTRK